ncbi:F0F1 ATP synthase subunit delta [Anaplasmataceae bacterium AB001_6]|nr:F0F1 ATP synthase subunit delta [Anaplasmataceae bacterium AB001_6]
MNDLIIAGNYARVILGKYGEEIIRELEKFCSLLSDSELLRDFLNSTLIGKEEKESLLKKIVNDKKLLKLLLLLNQNKKMYIVSLLMKQLTYINLKLKGVTKLTIESSRKLSDETVSKVQDGFVKKVKIRTFVEQKLNSALGSGFIAYTDNYVMDASLNNLISKINERCKISIRKSFGAI